MKNTTNNIKKREVEVKFNVEFKNSSYSIEDLTSKIKSVFKNVNGINLENIKLNLGINLDYGQGYEYVNSVDLFDINQKLKSVFENVDDIRIGAINLQLPNTFQKMIRKEQTDKIKNKTNKHVKILNSIVDTGGDSFENPYNFSANKEKEKDFVDELIKDEKELIKASEEREKERKELDEKVPNPDEWREKSKPKQKKSHKVITTKVRKNKEI